MEDMEPVSGEIKKSIGSLGGKPKIGQVTRHHFWFPESIPRIPLLSEIKNPIDLLSMILISIYGMRPMVTDLYQIIFDNVKGGINSPVMRCLGERLRSNT